MSGKVSLERGEPFNWNEGRGYQAPSPRGDGSAPSIPPGWNTAPHEDNPEQYVQPPDPTPFPPPAPQPPSRPPASQDEQIMAAVEAAMQELDYPQEMVNLDKGTARFRGHSIVLSTQGLQRIVNALAEEVARSLDEERARVIGSVQHSGMQAPSRAKRKNMPKVSGSKKQVGKTAKSTKVLRVRKQGTASGTKDVSVVQGQKDHEAGTAS